MPTPVLTASISPYAHLCTRTYELLVPGLNNNTSFSPSFSPPTDGLLSTNRRRAFETSAWCPSRVSWCTSSRPAEHRMSSSSTPPKYPLACFRLLPYPGPAGRTFIPVVAYYMREFRAIDSGYGRSQTSEVCLAGGQCPYMLAFTLTLI